ncbi:uncharacterized protein EI90DRAFT_3013390 [Cantharellus anzutake]|uniref:uncharacterized protein n=1 Tax=Cantharellus anzutake TaxID=1750568 RepID=UPI00190780C6|nr:uncharacterized protein EI90DRAFT_3013390 [Cantharellus anzutake]KAF8338069.1 hypothetical protein EI90DRAFT_3013390 [Cantharellus anzutake]
MYVTPSQPRISFLGEDVSLFLPHYHWRSSGFEPDRTNFHLLDERHLPHASMLARDAGVRELPLIGFPYHELGNFACHTFPGIRRQHIASDWTPPWMAANIATSTHANGNPRIWRMCGGIDLTVPLCDTFRRAAPAVNSGPSNSPRKALILHATHQSKLGPGLDAIGEQHLNTSANSREKTTGHVCHSTARKTHGFPLDVIVVRREAHPRLAIRFLTAPRLNLSN